MSMNTRCLHIARADEVLCQGNIGKVPSVVLDSDVLYKFTNNLFEIIMISGASKRYAKPSPTDEEVTALQSTLLMKATSHDIDTAFFTDNEEGQLVFNHDLWYELDKVFEVAFDVYVYDLSRPINQEVVPTRFGAMELTCIHTSIVNNYVPVIPILLHDPISPTPYWIKDTACLASLFVYQPHVTRGDRAFHKSRALLLPQCLFLQKCHHRIKEYV